MANRHSSSAQVDVCYPTANGVSLDALKYGDSYARLVIDVDAPPFVRAFGAIAEAWRLAEGGHDCVRHIG